MHRNHLRKLPEGMRGKLAAEEGGETSSVKEKEGDTLGVDVESDSAEEEGSSGEEPDSDEGYFYPNVKKTLGAEEWDLKETTEVDHEVGGEVERTVDIHDFRRDESDGEVKRGAPARQNIDFWEVSEHWPREGNSSSRSSSMPDLEQVLRELARDTEDKFRKPRYTEFRKADREEQGEEGRTEDEDIERKEEGREREGSKSDSEGQSGLKTPRGDDGSETPPQLGGSGFDELETPPELKGKGMRTPPVKPNFERPIGASTPKPSALVADMRREEEETRDKCENLRERLENMDKDLENLGDRMSQGVIQGEVRRSGRNKNKKVNYKAERNPEGPYK